MMTHKTLTHRILPLLAAGLLFGACDDPTTVEEHLEVEGIAIFEGTTEIYRYMLDDVAPATFTLAQGAHDVAIVLLDHDGDPLVEEGHEDGEDEHVLEVSIADTGILTWSPEAHTDEPDFIEFRGELDALQAGSTTMELCIPHGDHCDFDADVPVTVNAP